MAAPDVSCSTKSRFALLSRTDWVVALGLAIGTFSINLVLALLWYRLGVFSEYNVIFDADPITALPCFGSGWECGGLFHPLLSHYFTIPIRVIQAAASAAGLVLDKVMFRESLALFVAPMFAGLKACCLFMSFRLLNLGKVDALLATTLGVAAFSSVVFGATPETYGITGASVALLTLLSVRFYDVSGKKASVAMMIAGLFAIGTTVSNVIYLSAMECARRAGRSGVVRAGAIAAVMGICVLGAAVGASGILAQLSSSKVRAQALAPNYGLVNHFSYTGWAKAENILRSPEFVARSLLPTMPDRVDNVEAIRAHNPIRFEYSYNTPGRVWERFLLWTFSLVAVGGGLLIAVRHGGMWRWIGLGSAASLLASMLLFSTFGLNTFLYSQNWQVQANILIATWLGCGVIPSRVARSIAVIALISLLMADLQVLQTMTQQIAARI